MLDGAVQCCCDELRELFLKDISNNVEGKLSDTQKEFLNSTGYLDYDEIKTDNQLGE